MGDIVRSDLCKKYITEFGKDALERHQVDAVWADKQTIEIDEDDMTVRHFIEAEDEDDEVIKLRCENTGVLFNPEWRDFEMTALISDSLEIRELEVERRLTKAGILIKTS